MPARLSQFKSVPGDFWSTPKELWGFRLRTTGRPVAAAERFLRDHVDLLGLRRIIGQLQRVRVIESLGATHVLFQQRIRGAVVHRGYVTVHISREGEAYLVKNRAIPLDHQPKQHTDFIMAPENAEALALGSLGAAGKDAVVRTPVRRWYPVRDRVRAAYRIRAVATKPRREWIIFVDAMTGAVLEKWDNVAHEPGWARIFDPNPVATAADWHDLLTPSGRPRKPPASAYRTDSLGGLLPGSMLDGVRVTTRPTPERVREPSRHYEYSSSEPGFLEAMGYYHIDRVLAYLEALGYKGRHAIFAAPVPVNAHGTRQDQSWYSPDTRSITFGTGGVDDAEDAEVILHELGHAIQDAICPDFGQTDEAAAMGEGFGDYLAASFFAWKKSPALRNFIMSWDSIAEGTEGNDPPYLRRMDYDVTYESFDHRAGSREHENGKIWSATLWDIFNALGRDVADSIIVESHFQLDAFTKMARGARAIIDADRNLYVGRHVARLRQIFRARGIGPVE
jgi:hypothetical protein